VNVYFLLHTGWFVNTRNRCTGDGVAACHTDRGRLAAGYANGARRC
jgi:hypothetical protein